MLRAAAQGFASQDQDLQRRVQDEDLNSWGGLQQRGKSTESKSKSKSRRKVQASPRDKPPAPAGQTTGAVNRRTGPASALKQFEGSNRRTAGPTTKRGTVALPGWLRH